jgi:2-succinyl-5-enolpyruvyl-6-hydroxy-3-cyclohexene-1-carboxylate synthase
MEQTANRNTFWAYTLADELVRAGLRRVVIAPGSRSTPLALAFGSCPELSVYVHLDERGAAFFALGLALSSGEPAAVLCTSGTAAANFFPAVVEAHQSQVPLLVLTADRPHALRDSGSNQTIDQVKLYGSYPRWSVDVAPPTAQPSDAAVAALRSLACRALAAAQGLPPGPVHLNLPYSKPLEPIEVEGEIPAAMWDAVSGPRAARPGATPFVKLERGRLIPSGTQIDALQQAIQAARRGIIYCGPRCPGGDFPDALLQLSEHTGFPIFADALSGLRFHPALAHSPAAVFGAYETFLQTRQVRSLPPADLVIQFGAVPTSKSLAETLDSLKTARRFQVASGGGWADDAFRTSDYLWADPALVCWALAGRLANYPWSVDACWRQTLLSAEQAAWQASEAARKERFFEGGVLAELPALLAPGEALFSGSSLPVRHLDQFARPQPHALRIFSNRGASGIDGTIASAVGALRGLPAPAALTLVLGDLALLHDLNSLLAVRNYGSGMTIVVINNDGGGIFQRLPIAAFDPLYTQLFRTPHGLHFESAARLFDLSYTQVDSYAALRQAFQSTPRPAIIEVAGDAAANEAVRSEILDAIERNFTPSERMPL